MAWSSIYFKIQEFVPPEIYNVYKENSIWFIDPNIVNYADFVRAYFGKPMTINNWHTGGQFSNRGFRMPDSTVGAKLSQHKLKNAIDFNIAGMTPQEVYNEILANEQTFMKAGLTTMEDIAFTNTWTHNDKRWTGLNNILIVNPQ